MDEETRKALASLNERIADLARALAQLETLVRQHHNALRTIADHLGPR